MAKYFTNQEIADLLKRVASAYEIKDKDHFRTKAYQEAAVAVEHSTSELKDLWDEGKLEEVPGFGKSIAGHIDELFHTGKVKHFREVFKGLPAAMFVFENIPGVGAKRAFQLAKDLKIISEKKAIEKLKKASQKGKVRLLEGFGEKSEEDLLRGIEAWEKGEVKEERMPLYVADSLAEEIIDYLKQCPTVLQAHPLGSLRRMLATIGDIDISVSTEDPAKVMEYFFRYPKIKQILSKGEEDLGRVILQNGRQVDIRFSRPESYGAMLQYFTGSKQHNIALRQYALKNGLSLSEYGIKKDSKLKPIADEKDFYHELGMEWIPPEIREDTGEIEAALHHQLPRLIEMADIKGDLHLHSDFPIEPGHDVGESSLEEMLAEAKRLHYEYLGFSEHNPSFSRHSSSSVLDLLKRKNECLEQFVYSHKKDLINRENNLPIQILNGLEIDIQPTGELAIPEQGFDLLDYVIASIHSSFQMTKEEMTKRVLAGLSHPKVKIFGHPTGRKIGEREGIELDWERVFDFCLKNNKILEISAWPDRLDLPDFLVREAVKKRVRLAIGSDSHSVDQMKLMEYGVAVARRGWAEKKDILNTLSLGKLNDILLKA